MKSVRSPKLPSLYSRKTDCLVEWVCGVLNEEDSVEAESFRSYMNDYLAYSEEHSHLLELYFKNSLRNIRKLKTCVSRIDQINDLFDSNIHELSQAIDKKDHVLIESRLKDLFNACEKIAS